MSSLVDVALNALLFVVPLIHLVVAPHTKVEESFNLQATHDILVYGTPVTNSPGQRLASSYDHFTFPGAVPRTFLGSIILAGLSQPVIALVGFSHAQFIVRAVLGLLNASSLLFFRFSLDTSFGKPTGRWWIVLMACQFHVAFYLTRTLPNMFSFGLTTMATALLMPSISISISKKTHHEKQAIFLLVISAVIFRSETAILLATTSLHLLLTGRIQLPSLITTGFLCSVATILLSVPFDSYFWQQFPLWPELSAFYFNAVQGSSSDWGISPWHYYFTSALPRILLNPASAILMLFAMVIPATSRRARDLMIPSALYIAIYSLQPHKEARFIFYVLPPFTAVAALGASYISSRVSKSKVYALATLSIVLSVAISAAIGTGMLLLSSLNYPGGDALAQLAVITQEHHHHTSVSHNPPVIVVHADVLTCMTGLTLFGQNPNGLPIAFGSPPPSDAFASASSSSRPVIMFDKTEDDEQLETAAFWKQFDYILAEDTSKILGGQWKTVAVVQAYDGIELLRPGQPSKTDLDGNQDRKYRFVGRGVIVSRIRDLTRSITGGWWIGPRMSPRIHILQQVREAAEARDATI